MNSFLTTSRIRSIVWALSLFVLGRMTVAAEPPVAYVAAASLDRVLDNVDRIAGAAEVPHFAQLLRGFLGNLNNLKGIDRAKPFGVMLFAPAQIGGDPVGIVFLPVSDLADLKTTAKIGNLISLEDGGSPERLNLKTPEKTLPVRLSYGFAFISDRDQAVDRELPDPNLAIADLLTRYDLVVTMRRDGIPQPILETVRHQLDEAGRIEIPREGSESDADLALKREVAAGGLRAARAFYEDLERLDIGWKLDADSLATALEANAIFRSGSSVVDTLHSLSASPSRFAATGDEPAPLSVNLHLNIPENVRQLLGRVVDRLSEQSRREVAKSAAALLPAVDQTLDSIRKTVEAGQLDAFLRVVGGPPDHFQVFGGMSVGGAEGLAKALSSILPFAQQAPNAPKIDMDAVRIADIPFHRIRNLQQRPQDKLLYGEDASLLVGIGRDAAWFALGEEAPEEELTHVAESHAVNDRMPSLLSVHFSLTDWVGMIRERDENARKFRAAVQKAFPQPEDDGIDLTVSSTPTGLQARLELEQGFLRLLGAMITESGRK
jgi:hypothetical protein